MKNAEALTALIAGRVGTKDWSEWEPEFDAWDAPWELIRTLEDVKTDPQVIANGLIFNLSVGDTPVMVVAGPATFDGQASPKTPTAAPGMGEQTESLLAGAGYSPDEIADLKARKIVQ